MRVLVIPDKFKGTLSAPQAARAIAAGWAAARPADELDLLPMSDGGDGFGQLMAALVQGKVQKLRALDAAHRPGMSRWWWEPGSKTAIIESAAVIGLAMLPPGRFHPFDLDTFGLGTVIRAASGKGAARCVLGIGGSATNDGGFGMARALGWNFQDRNGNRIARWCELDRLACIQAPRRRRWFRELTVAVDVRNPLLGPRGATRVYGPQKGLRPEDFAQAERCLGRLAAVVKRDLGRDIRESAGAGAAGGLGFGLVAFLGAKLQPGFEMFSRLARLNARLNKAACVVTGEGSIDNSTLMGKGVAQLAARCRRLGVPCVALAGVLKAKPAALKLFSTTYALSELTNTAEAKAHTAVWLKRLARKAAADFRDAG